jgi:CRP-like cAMP-binding protein/CheY-like chemotaxis protein
MKKILLIEDNSTIRENTSEILELSNYHVCTAEDGKSGVEAALREKPDLIICDIMMPVLDGYAVLHMLQKNASTKNTPFIFLTAKTERSDMRKGMELGADDYITKPYTGTELLNAVASRLKKSEQVKESSAAFNIQNGETPDGNNAKEILKQFISDRNINRYKKKQLIFSEGNRPANLFYVIRGKVKTYKANEDGKELVLDLFKQGDFLGHTAMLENCNYKETAAAMEETELAVIPRIDFEELINSNHEISLKFIQMLASNISEKEQHLLSLAYNSLRKKVADALILIYRKYRESNSSQFKIDLSRDNLATIAGTATESLIRTLSEFKAEKLIDIEDSVITILDEKRLDNLLN